MISSDEFAAYNRAVARIGDKAASDVESSVLAWCRDNASATVAEKREAAKLIMDGYIQGYDDIAAEFAAEWYDHRAEKSGIKLDQAITMTTYSPESVDDVARYQAKKLLDGDDAAFAKACGEYARNDLFRSLNETIIANVGRDKDKGARFARVPTGFETCTFCLMLASRNAVYHTRKTAGEFKHFHRHCDCKVVPSFDPDPDAEVVEGVKPRELRDQWWKFEKIDATEGLSAAERDELKRRVLDGGELPENVKKTNPTAHMRKAGRASSGWISAGNRLNAEVKSHGFRDVSDFYEYLESRRSAAEIVEAGALGEKILANADATPKFYEIVKGHLHKSVELADGVSPKELREWSKRFKEIDAEDDLTKGQRNVAKMKAMRGATSSDAVTFARNHVLKSSQVLFTDKQVGKKLGKHAGDWGLDPGSDKDRDELLSIIRRIIDEADRVDFGIWRGQTGPCAFYIKGDDLVLIDGNGKFASVMKGGVNNKRYKSGTARGDRD